MTGLERSVKKGTSGRLELFIKKYQILGQQKSKKEIKRN